MHERQTLRAAAVAALKTGVPAVSSRVSGVRLFSRNAPALPAIEVATPSDQVSRRSSDGAFVRMIDLVVSVFDAAGEGIDDDLDAIAEAVEATIHGIADVQEIQASVDYGSAGEKRPARLDMVFTVMTVETVD